MGLFSRNRRQQQAARIIPADALARLASIGQARYRDGQHVDVSGFYLPGVTQVLDSGASPGSPGWEAFTEQLLAELLAGGEAAGGGWAIVGAFEVANDFVGVSEIERYTTFEILTDQALSFMASAGVSTMHIPMGLVGRWKAPDQR